MYVDSERKENVIKELQMKLDYLYEMLPREEFLDTSYKNMMICNEKTKGSYFDILDSMDMTINVSCHYYIYEGRCKNYNGDNQHDAYYIYWPMHQLVHRSLDDLFLFVYMCESNNCKTPTIDFFSIKVEKISKGIYLPKIEIKDNEIFRVVSSLRQFYGHIGYNANKILVRLFRHYNICKIHKNYLEISHLRSTQTNNRVDRSLYSNRSFKNVIEEIDDCDKRFVVIPLHINYRDGGKHANTIIIDHASEIIELYEPHGESSVDIREKFLNKLGKTLNYKVMYSKDTCTRRGVQFIELVFEQVYRNNPKYRKYFQDRNDVHGDQHTYTGHCALWSLLLLLARIYNPDKSPIEITNALYAHLNKNDYDAIIDMFMNIVAITKLG